MIQFWAPRFKRDTEVMECPKKGNKAGKRSREESCREQLRELGLFSLERRRLRGGGVGGGVLIVLYNYLTGGCRQVGSISAPR